MFLPKSRPAVEIAQLDFQDGCLQGIEAEIPSNHPMMVFRLRSLETENAEPFRQRLIIGNHHSSVAKTTQILAGEEGETTCDSHAPGSATIPILRSDGLRRVLHNSQIMACRDLKNGIHLSTLPV